MSARRGALAFAIAVSTAGVLSPPCPARAAEPSPAQCASAYENAQLLRQRGRLVGARDAALVCARASCPEVARGDCAAWATELGKELPTVVVVVRDATDADVHGARVMIDGTVRPDAATGRAFEIDPGEHVFRIELVAPSPGGPTATTEQTIAIVQGEHDRLISFTLAAAAAPASSPAASAPSSPSPTPLPAPSSSYSSAASPSAAPSSSPPQDTGARRVSYAPAAVSAGVAALFLGASAWLGLDGRSDLSHLRATCAPACSDAEVDPVRRKLLLSDVALAAGAVAAAVSVYFFVRPPASGSPPTVARIGIAPARGGAALTLTLTH